MAERVYDIKIRNTVENPQAYAQAQQGIESVAQATEKAARATEHQTQADKDLAAARASLEKSFANADKTLAGAKAGLPSDGPKDLAAAIKDKVKDIRADSRAVRAGSDTLGDLMDPEGMLKEEVANLFSKFTSSIPMLAAGMATVTGLFAGGRMAIKGLLEEDKNLGPAVDNLSKAFQGLAVNALKPFIGEAAGITKAINWITEAMGGETEAMKAAHGPIQGLISLHEKAKTATELWSDALKDIKADVDGANTAIEGYNKTLALLDKGEMAELERQHAEELRQINEDQVASEEDKTVRIIEAATRLEDAKDELNARSREREMEAARERQKVLEQEEADIAEEFLQQHERVEKLNKLAVERDKVNRARAALEEANAKLEGRDGKGKYISAGMGGATYVPDLTYDKDIAEMQRKQRAFDDAEKKRKAVADSIAGGTEGVNPDEEKKALDAKREALDNKEKELQKKREELQNKENDNEIKRQQEEQASEQRRKDAQRKIDQATGQGDFAGQGGIDQKAADAAALAADENAWNEWGKDNGTSQKGPSNGSQGGSGSGSVGTLNVNTLNVKNANGMGGGSGKGGGGNGGNADSGDDFNAMVDGTNAAIAEEKRGRNAKAGLHAGESAAKGQLSDTVGNNEGVITGHHGGGGAHKSAGGAFSSGLSYGQQKAFDNGVADSGVNYGVNSADRQNAEANAERLRRFGNTNGVGDRGMATPAHIEQLIKSFESKNEGSAKALGLTAKSMEKAADSINSTMTNVGAKLATVSNHLDAIGGRTSQFDKIVAGH